MRRAGVAILSLLILAAPGDALGQGRLLASASGDTLVFTETALRRMLDTTRALRRDLEEDPRILYFTATGPGVPAEEPGAAYPWSAVDVLADSVATIRTPGNLREADRAYANYAVLRMKNVRRDPDVSCDSLFSREVRAVSGFVDGWIVSRTLFGAPGYAPLDELAFARQAGVLAGLIAAREDPQLGGCLRVWAESHADALEAYRRWRETGIAGTGAAAARSGRGNGRDEGNNPAVRPYRGR